MLSVMVDARVPEFNELLMGMESPLNKYRCTKLWRPKRWNGDLEECVFYFELVAEDERLPLLEGYAEIVEEDVDGSQFWEASISAKKTATGIVSIKLKKEAERALYKCLKGVLLRVSQDLNPGIKINLNLLGDDCGESDSESDSE